MFSWLKYDLPLSFVALGYSGLLMAFMYNDEANDSKLINRTLTRLAVIQTLVFIVSLIAVAGALYIAWTPVGRNWVDGIQGRYFLPLIPLLIPIFMVIKRKVKITTDKLYTMGILVCVISGINLIAMLAATYKWFY
jgi:Predicted membrane protein